MIDVMTPSQQAAVERLTNHIRHYLDARYTSVRRMNSKLEAVWDDLAWQQLSQLYRTFAADKAFGPIRFHVAESLVGDDERRIRELLSLTNQNSIMPEILEKEEDETKSKRMEGATIRDMRTLYRTIDPSLQNAVMLIQSFIWIDLEDAIDLSRVETKEVRLQQFATGGITDAHRKYYMEIWKREAAPADDEIITFELVQARKSMMTFVARRENEEGYRQIIVREIVPQESPEVLVPALANHLRILGLLRNGGTIDDTLRAQFGQALHCDPKQVTSSSALAFIERTIIEEKHRLRSSLNGQSSGKPYNLKLRQAEEVKARFEAMRAGRTLPEPSTSAVAKPKEA